MQHRIEHPTAITPAELDRYLREGWYRMGQSMITCRFIVSDEEARGVVWARTRLAGYQLSRSNRRLMRRNRRRYSVREGPLRIDEEHEALYQRYLEVAPGQRSATLAGSLLGSDTEDRFATREIALRDEHGQLVGFSAFDVGVDSVQSLMGVYDPTHRRASLGYWSLLLEVEHAIELGLRYHYAGYVVPQHTDMNYKLRVGQIEFLDPDDGRWRPWDEFDAAEDPAVQLESQLDAVHSALRARGVPSRIEGYRWFEAPAWSSALETLLAEPRVVMLGAESASPLTLVSWSFDSKRYDLMLCARVTVHSKMPDGEREFEMLLIQDRVTLGADPMAAATAVAHWWSMPNRIVTRSPSDP